MSRSMKVTMLSTLAVGALSNECSPGYIHKPDLTGLNCMGSTEDAASCNSECCELHKGTCGGLADKGKVKCDWDKYQPQEPAALNALATDANANSMCCKAKATCSQATCKPGYKLNTANAAQKCSGGPETCDDIGNCCIKDKLTCGGSGQTCKAGNAKKGSDDAWRKTAVAADNQNAYDTACCAVTAKCTAAPTCPAGQKAKAGVTATPCQDKKGQPSTLRSDCNRNGVDYLAAVRGKDAQGVVDLLEADKVTTAKLSAVQTELEDPTTARLVNTLLENTGKAKEMENAYPAVQKFTTALKAAIVLKANPCCVDNPLTCGGSTLACGAGYVPAGYGSGWSGIIIVPTGTPTPAQFDAKCCVKKSVTCQSFTCPAGQKKKLSSAKLACSGSAETCETTCCQPDTEKCGGFYGNIQCKYGFFYEPDNWISPSTGKKSTPQSTIDEWMNKAANATNKNIKCCTTRVACAIGTTTPYPTATPGAGTATPAALFSQHKIKSEKKKEESPKLLWLGAGSFVGMAVLSLARTLRSKPKQLAADAETDSEENLLSNYE